MVKSKSPLNSLADMAIWFILTLLMLLCLYPLINTVSVSFSDKAVAAGNLVYVLPVKFTLSSYKTLMDEKQFFVSFGISVLRVILGGSLNMVLTILMAYPLSKDVRAFKWRNKYMWFIVFTMLFNGGLIPWYITVRKLHLLNSLIGLVVAYGAVPVFHVILLMNFFKGVPKALEESAVIDGANPWSILFRIYIPVSLPAMATITLFCIVGHWNEFFYGMIIMSSPAKYPLQTYIQQLTVSFSLLNMTDPEQIKRYSEVSNRTLDAAKIVASTIPLLIVYPFLQRYFVSGIVMGSVKE